MQEFKRSDLHRPKKRKKVVRWIILPVLLVLLSVVAYGAHLYSQAESVMEDSYEPIEREGKRVAVDPIEDNISILFIGVDDSQKRQESNSRTDALMIATFNKDERSVKLLSIPRDSYVYIPGKGINDKINHAHAFGGVEMTLNTVENLLDIPVDYYVKMNFNAFIDVIDAFNGIEVEVPYTFTEQDSSDRAGAITLQEGLQTLNGEEALALARTRKLDNDIERGKRQQEIIKAIVKKAASVSSLSSYTNVIEAIGDNMTTDLRFEKMSSFVNYAFEGTNLNVENLTLNGENSIINNIYYYQLDETSLGEVKSTLKKHLGLLSESETGIATDVPTSTETGSTGTSNTEGTNSSF